MMGLNKERTPAEWFEEAVRCYAEGHQACASCGRPHCVFRSEWGPRVEYHCSGCDFSVCHDGQTGRHIAVPGQDGPLPETLLGVEDPPQAGPAVWG
jgi:hypothetical protein